MTAVISFMHLSPLSPVKTKASDLACAYYVLKHLQLPCQRAVIRAINELRKSRVVRCTDMARSSGYGALRKCEARADFEEGPMSFINSSGLDELARRLADSVPESVRAFGRDLEGNFKAVLQAQLSKLDLVSRQEFDVQAALLARTQANLSAMEARLKEIEAKLTPQ
jgi:ubiquinone biosynthesis accessory factor UbiK